LHNVTLLENTVSPITYKLLYKLVGPYTSRLLHKVTLLEDMNPFSAVNNEENTDCPNTTKELHKVVLLFTTKSP